MYEHLGKKRVKCLAVVKKNEWFCDNKEKTMTTDSALDEIVSSFLHEILSVYTRFSVSVEFIFS